MEDGGTAFPNHMSCMTPGMSLRDWFAGMAVHGHIIADQRAADNPDKAAEWAYATADAMLKERAK